MTTKNEKTTTKLYKRAIKTVNSAFDICVDGVMWLMVLGGLYVSVVSQAVFKPGEDIEKNKQEKRDQ